MKKLLTILVWILFSSWLIACNDPPKVIQGTVTAIDPAGKTVSMSDELAPEAVVTFAMEKAKIGATPEVGDLLRIAYRVTDGRNMAHRVMNITRQTELKGVGNKTH